MAKQWWGFDSAANAAFEEWNHICGCGWKSFWEMFEPMPWIYELGTFVSVQEKDISEQHLPGEQPWPLPSLGRASNDETGASLAWLLMMTAQGAAGAGP